MIYEERPPRMSVARTREGFHTTVNFNIEEVEGGYTAESVTIVTDKKTTIEDYGRLVTAIIRSRYSADEVEAITQNYVAAKSAEHKAEWNALQAWRTEAKRLAKEVLGDGADAIQVGEADGE